MSLKVIPHEVGVLRAEGQQEGQGRLFVERDILTRIGAYMQGVTSRAFRDQGRGGEKWPERMTPSVPSIVRQLNREQPPSEKYFKSAPALIDLGTLSRSIAYDVEDRSVVIGSTAPYSSNMQYGIASQITLEPVGRKFLAGWLRSLPRAKRRTRSAQLGWLFRKPSFTVTPRPRVFLEVLPEDEKEFRQIVAQETEAASRE